MSTPTPQIDQNEPELDEAPVPPEATESPSEPPPKNREERFRARAQAAETRVAELEVAAIVTAAQLEKQNRRAAERYVTDLLANPAELWRDGTTLDDMLDVDGVTSEDAVRARATQLAEQHSYLRAPKPQRTPPASVVTGDGKPGGGGTSWPEAFGPQKT